MTRERVAVVTGANRGIGEAIAHELARRGVRVVGTSRDGRAGFTPLDVTQPASVAAFAAGVEVAAKGGVDILVNNAGASFDGFDASVAERTLDVNVFGAERVTDALLPLMPAGARIVMVSSGMGALSHVSAPLAARFSDPTLDRAGLAELLRSFVADVRAGVHVGHGWPSNAYSVSKVGMNALTRVMARELAADPRRILINAACPGWVRTRMGGSSAPRSVERGAATPVWLAMLPADASGPSGGFFRDERPIDW